MVRNILVAFDGSPGANSALHLGLKLARALEAQLHVLMVIDLHRGRSGVEVEAERRHAWQMLRALEPSAERTGVVMDSRVVDGVPAQQIVLRANELAACLVVLGRGPRPTFLQRLTASTDTLVIGQAPCAVMFAPPAEAAAA